MRQALAAAKSCSTSITKARPASWPSLPTQRLIFILPPSLPILEARLRGRGTDSEEVIATRLRKARDELSHFRCTTTWS